MRKYMLLDAQNLPMKTLYAFSPLFSEANRHEALCIMCSEILAAYLIISIRINTRCCDSEISTIVLNIVKVYNQKGWAQFHENRHPTCKRQN